MPSKIWQTLGDAVRDRIRERGGTGSSTGDEHLTSTIEESLHFDNERASEVLITVPIPVPCEQLWPASKRSIEQ